MSNPFEFTRKAGLWQNKRLKGCSSQFYYIGGCDKDEIYAHRALQLNIYELLCSLSRLAWTVKGRTWTWIQVWKNKTEMRIHRFPLLTRHVTQQTGKGEIHRRSVLVVVGNGDGLVGYGEAKHDDGPYRCVSIDHGRDPLLLTVARTIWAYSRDELICTGALYLFRYSGTGGSLGDIIQAMKSRLSKQ